MNKTKGGNWRTSPVCNFIVFEQKMMSSIESFLNRSYARFASTTAEEDIAERGNDKERGGENEKAEEEEKREKRLDEGETLEELGQEENCIHQINSNQNQIKSFVATKLIVIISALFVKK